MVQIIQKKARKGKQMNEKEKIKNKMIDLNVNISKLH